MDPSLSGPTVRVVLGLGGPCTTLSLGLRSGGLESQIGRVPRPRDRRVVGWSCLFLGYKQSGMACLRSSTIVRTER